MANSLIDYLRENNPEILGGKRAPSLEQKLEEKIDKDSDIDMGGHILTGLPTEVYDANDSDAMSLAMTSLFLEDLIQNSNEPISSEAEDSKIPTSKTVKNYVDEKTANLGEGTPTPSGVDSQWYYKGYIETTEDLPDIGNIKGTAGWKTAVIPADTKTRVLNKAYSPTSVGGTAFTNLLTNYSNYGSQYFALIFDARMYGYVLADETVHLCYNSYYSDTRLALTVDKACQIYYTTDGINFTEQPFGLNNVFIDDIGNFQRSDFTIRSNGTLYFKQNSYFYSCHIANAEYYWNNDMKFLTGNEEGILDFDYNIITENHLNEVYSVGTKNTLYKSDGIEWIKLANCELDEEMSNTSENGVQNKVVKEYVDALPIIDPHWYGKGHFDTVDNLPKLDYLTYETLYNAYTGDKSNTFIFYLEDDITNKHYYLCKGDTNTSIKILDNGTLYFAQASDKCTISYWNGSGWSVKSTTTYSGWGHPLNSMDNNRYSICAPSQIVYVYQNIEVPYENIANSNVTIKTQHEAPNYTDCVCTVGTKHELYKCDGTKWAQLVVGERTIQSITTSANATTVAFTSDSDDNAFALNKCKVFGELNLDVSAVTSGTLLLRVRTNGGNRNLGYIPSIAYATGTIHFSTESDYDSNTGITKSTAIAIEGATGQGTSNSRQSFNVCFGVANVTTINDVEIFVLNGSTYVPILAGSKITIVGVDA